MEVQGLQAVSHDVEVTLSSKETIKTSDSQGCGKVALIAGLGSCRLHRLLFKLRPLLDEVEHSCSSRLLTDVVPARLKPIVSQCSVYPEIARRTRERKTIEF